MKAITEFLVNNRLNVDNTTSEIKQKILDNIATDVSGLDDGAYVKFVDKHHKNWEWVAKCSVKTVGVVYFYYIIDMEQEPLSPTGFNGTAEEGSFDYYGDKMRTVDFDELTPQDIDVLIACEKSEELQQAIKAGKKIVFEVVKETNGQPYKIKMKNR